MVRDAYFRMADSAHYAEVERKCDALLEYCKLDTAAMFMIVERLKELVA